MARATSRRNWLILALLALLLGLGSLQVWSALATRDVVTRALGAQGPARAADLEREKARQEIIGKTIENNSKALLQTNLVSALGAGLGVIISVSGGLIALFGYFDARDKERADRLEAEDKARGDRLAGTLGETLGRLASGVGRRRAVGAAGLLPFFSAEREEFHLQALAALITLAKSADEPIEVQEGARVAIEQAARTVDPVLMRKLSWRRVRLAQADLSGCDLSGLDLRDAILSNAVLDGASLAGSNLTAAKLLGARLTGADLSGANLTYADLAGADLRRAKLRGASLDNVGILNVDFEAADLRGLASGWRTAPWDAAHNWRKASFDGDVRAALDRVYGTAIPPIRILMLLWEVPPFVAGGTWTAAYHLVRKLRRRGADVTVVTPWRRDLLDNNPFGLDVPIVGLGVTPPRNAGPGGYDTYGSYSSYSGSSGPLGVYSSYGTRGLFGSVLYVLLDEFRARLVTYLAEQSFDLVHAHDWVTFGAAQAAAETLGKPWIAHFHSTEDERNAAAPDTLTMAIERDGVANANAAVAPSEVTKRRLLQTYHAPGDGVLVVPNVLTDEPVSPEDIGSFEARKVVFVGRLAVQKGFDRFSEIATRTRNLVGNVRFEAVGSGQPGTSAPGVTMRGALPWEDRSEAFRGATAVVMPSRAEPFGMVVLEAMIHRTPILYPRESGAAEVLESGIKVDPAEIDGMFRALERLLGDPTYWETTVRAQATEIEAYVNRDYEDRLVDLWVRAAAIGSKPL